LRGDLDAVDDQVEREHRLARLLGIRDDPAVHRLDDRSLESQEDARFALAAEQVASRLDDRFRLLTGGSRTALPRQQTLRALIDWSYDLLSDSERKLFRKFSVFAGGCTYEAAEGICSEMDVLNLISQLVNKSLVAVEARTKLANLLKRFGSTTTSCSVRWIRGKRNVHFDYFYNLSKTAEPVWMASGLEWIGRLAAGTTTSAPRWWGRSRTWPRPEHGAVAVALLDPRGHEKRTNDRQGSPATPRRCPSRGEAGLL
jgi:hypothetical protein